MAEAYPLEWPKGRERTPVGRREHARFTTNFARARDAYDNFVACAAA